MWCLIAGQGVYDIKAGTHHWTYSIYVWCCVGLCKQLGLYKQHVEQSVRGFALAYEVVSEGDGRPGISAPVMAWVCM